MGRKRSPITARIVLWVLAATSGGCSVPFGQPFPDAEKTILAFGFEDPKVEVIVLAKTSDIVVWVPFGTNVRSLVPQVRYEGVAIEPEPGVPLDFTNPVIYRVTSQVGAVRTYRVRVVVRAADDARLAALRVSSGTLVPAFTPEVIEYSVSLPHSVTSLWVEADPVPGASALLSPSAPTTLEVGPNHIRVAVTTPGGTATTYTVTVFRGAPPVGVDVDTEVTITLSGPTTLGVGETTTVTATPSVAVDSYTWYLDGSVLGGPRAPTIILGGGLSRGPHSLTVVVSKEGVLFSQSLYFVVQ